MGIWRNSLILGAFVLALLSGCAKEQIPIEYGIQPNHISYVPARIAVMPCRLWPDDARFAQLPLTNISKEERQSLCAAFDKFVLQGFEGQPFMRGISPRLVMKILTKLKGDEFISKLDKLWIHGDDDCQTCTTPPAFYALSIADRPEWRRWLGDLSRAVRDADAALVPFVVFGYRKAFDDRGVMVKQLVAEVAMFLIDTNSGFLLWAGGRRGEVGNQALAPNGKAQEPADPQWSLLYSRLFIEEMWKEFPGRQVYH